MSTRTRPPAIRIVPAEEPDPSAAAEVLPILATSLFCDDVRVETTGKLILIGCYPGNMIVLNPAQPVDRLWVFTKITWPKDFDVTGMRLRIDMPAQEPGFVTVQNNPAPAPDMSPGATCVWQLRFLPLRPGDLIRVGVELGGRVVPSGELLTVAPAPPAPITRH
jgi:hypothetical protein